MKEASGGFGIYTGEKLAPPQKKKNFVIATEISVSVAKLLVLPVWGAVATSGLYLVLFSDVERRRYRWERIEHARKLCRSR